MNRILKLIIGLRDNASKGLAKIASRLDKMATRAEKAGPAFAVVTAAIIAGGTAALIAAGKFEQWRVAFETMLGRADTAAQLLDQIREFAAKTPFELPQVVEGAKKLLAFGFAADEIIDKFTTLGNIASGVGTDKLPSLVLAFGKIRTKGKASMEELNILLEAGVPILDALAKNLGVTTQALFKMVTAGKVGFTEVDKALESIGRGSGQFAGLMVRQSKTLFGVFSNISDSVFQTAEAFGQILLPSAKAVGLVFVSLLDKLKKLSPGTKKLILVIGGAAAVFTGLLAGISALVFVFPVLAAAFLTIFSPIGAMAAALTAVGIIAAGLATNFGGLRTNLGELAKSFLALRDIVIRTIEEMSKPFRSFLDALAALNERDFGGAAENFGKAWAEASVIAKRSAANASKGIGDAFDKTTNGIAAAFNEAAEKAKDALKGVKATGIASAKELSATEADERQKALVAITEANIAILEIEGRTEEARRAQFALTIDKQIESLEKLKAKFPELGDVITKTQDRMRDSAAQVGRGMEDLKEITESTQSAVATSFSSNFADVLLEAKSFEDAMSGIAKAVARAFIQAALRIAALRIFSAFTGGGASVALPALGGGVPQGLPGFKHGGEVPGIGPQLIKAHGGEVVAPRQDFQQLMAAMAPNLGGGGAGPTIGTLNLRVADLDPLERERLLTQLSEELRNGSDGAREFATRSSDVALAAGDLAP